MNVVRMKVASTRGKRRGGSVNAKKTVFETPLIACSVLLRIKDTFHDYVRAIDAQSPIPSMFEQRSRA